jgi:hypothetical protein
MTQKTALASGRIHVIICLSIVKTLIIHVNHNQRGAPVQYDRKWIESEHPKDEAGNISTHRKQVKYF